MSTGETGEQKLVHGRGEAPRFYRQLSAPVLIGMEATGNSPWFLELVQDLGHEIGIGDAAQIRARYVRQQKTDKRDAAPILKLVVEGRFPRRWTPDREQRDLRQLVLHRHKLVEIRSRVKNERPPLSLHQGMPRKAKLWSPAGQKLLRELRLKPWAACRREDLLGLLTMLNEQIGKLDQAVQPAAEEPPQAKLLMTQPGVGPNRARAYVLTMGDVTRFPRGQQVASYLGLIPREEIHFLLDHQENSRALSEVLILAAEIPDDDPTGQTEVGQLFLRAGDAQHALKHFVRSMALERNNPAALAGAGDAAFQLGDYVADSCRIEQ